MSLLLAIALSVNTASAVEFIAHRANYDFPIPNSLAATRRALTSTVDAVELDVRVSSNGLVYLYHDDKIDGKKLDELSFAEVRVLASVSRTPLLQDILTLGVPKNFYLLDLKINNIDALEPLVTVVRESGINIRKIIFQSHRLDILQWLEHKVPLSKRFYLTPLKREQPFFLAPTADRVLSTISGYDIDGISLKGRNFLDAEYISALKNAGLRVYIWTINDIERIEDYVAMGVDGIITDIYRQIERRNVESL